MAYYTRADWGAAKPTRSMARLDPKRVRYWTLHFDGSGALGLRDLRALMRAFQRYHQQTRGFADIAYNSGAGQSGDRAEGRGAYVGGHLLASQNAESWGCIAAIGATEVPTPALLAALREDYEAACRWAGRRLVPRGHTQWPDANKACPGTHLVRFLATLTLPPTSPASTTQEDFLMALTDSEQRRILDAAHRIMGGIPAGSAGDRTSPDGKPARVLDSEDGDYLRLLIERQGAAIAALTETVAQLGTGQGVDPALIRQAVADAIASIETTVSVRPTGLRDAMGV